MKITVSNETIKEQDLLLQVGDIFETAYGKKRLVIVGENKELKLLDIEGNFMLWGEWANEEELSKDYGTNGERDRAVKLYRGELVLTLTHEIGGN